MNGWRQVIPAVMVALVATTTGYAGMVSMPHLDAGYQSSPPICDRTGPEPGNPSSSFVDFAGSVDPGSLTVASLSRTGAEAGQAQPPHLLVENQSGLGLFLYALMGIGLYRSAPWVKKSSFGLIPDWYHNSGPAQIGHSHVIGPDLCFAPAYGFIQPDSGVKNPMPQHDREIVVSLWWKSQFAPAALASRGPPA